MGSDAYIRGEEFYFFDFETVWTCHKLGENHEPPYKSKNSSFSKVYDFSTHLNHGRNTAIG